MDEVPGHRANILGDYTDIGIAFVSVKGKTWGVQDFGKYPGHVGPAAPVPAEPVPVEPVPVASPATIVSTPLPSSPSAAPSPSVTSTSVHSGAADSRALDVRAQAQQTAALPVIGTIALAVVAIGFGFWYVLWRRARRQPRAAHRRQSPRSRARG